MKRNKIIKLLTFITVLNVSSFILHSKDDENVSISNKNVNINNKKNNYEEKEKINIKKIQENDINENDIIYNDVLVKHSEEYKKLKSSEYLAPAYDYLSSENIDDGIMLLADSDKDSYEGNNSFKESTLLSTTPEENIAPSNYSCNVSATLHRDPWYYVFWRDIDEDYYRFDVYGNAEINISLTNVPSNVDYDIEIYQHDNTYDAGFDNTELISGLEGCQGKAGVSENIWNLYEPGTYYIRVFPCGDDSYDAVNAYNLSLSVNYYDTESVSIKDLRYNKGCKAAMWVSDFNPVSIKPFSTLEEEQLFWIYPGAQVGGVGYNPLLNYVYYNHEVEHASLYLWDNEMCLKIHNFLNDIILPNLKNLKNEYDEGRIEFETQFEVINGINTMVSLIMIFIPNVSLSTNIIVGGLQSSVPPVYETIIKTLYPEYWDTRVEKLIDHTEDIIQSLKIKGTSTDDSQVIKISSVYNTSIKLTASSVYYHYASWSLELPTIDFVYESDLIPTFNERSYVYGHVYGIRNSSDYDNAINGGNYYLENTNSSPSIPVNLNQAYIDDLNDGEYHWYKYTAINNGYYNFYTEGQNIDTYGEIFSSEVVAQSIVGRIAFDDDSGGNGNFNIRYYLNENQSIYIRVRGYNWLKQNSYSFKASKEDDFVSYSANADDFSSFVNASGGGQYFFYEVSENIVLDEGLKIDTLRLRSSYIENEYLVLSAFRANAGTAFLELNFDEKIKSIGFDIGLWSSIEQITSSNSTVLLQYKDYNGNWVNIIDFMKVGMYKSKTDLENYYIPLERYDSSSLRFIVTANNPSGDRNKGRVVLDNFEFNF